jgi:hypothetical protein
MWFVFNPEKIKKFRHLSHWGSAAHAACIGPVKAEYNKLIKEKYTLLSCDFHRAQTLISDTPIHMFQQSEYPRPVSKCLSSVR